MKNKNKESEEKQDLLAAINLLKDTCNDLYPSTRDDEKYVRREIIWSFVERIKKKYSIK